MEKRVYIKQRYRRSPQKPRGGRTEKKKKRENARGEREPVSVLPPKPFLPYSPVYHAHVFVPQTSKHPPRTFSQSSSISITTTRNHTTKHQHPHQEHRADDPEGESRLPLLTDAALLQPRERVEI